MKNIHRSFKLTAVLLMLFCARISQAQCSATVTAYPAGTNGQFNFQLNPSSNTPTNAVCNWLISPSTSFTTIAGTGTTVSMTFTATGNYTIVVSISGSTCSTNAGTVFTVNNICNLAPSFSLSSLGNGSVMISNTSTGNTPAYTFSVNWGDNSTLYSLAGSTAVHHYTANTTYPVTLFHIATSTLSPACTGSITQMYTVTTSCNLSAQFSFTPGANNTLSLTNLSTGTNSNTAYNINWGDNTINGPNPHTYSASGIYTVTLTDSIPNSGGCYSAISHTVSVSSSTCNLVASFYLTALGNGSVQLTSTSTGTNVPGFGFQYDWGDGTGLGSSYSNPHTYTATGIYTVTLIDSAAFANCYSSATHTIAINSIGSCSLLANFSTSNNGSGFITLNNLTTNTTSTTNYTVYWGDGNVNTNTMTHQYTLTGVYTITMTASDGPCHSISVHTVTINAACSLLPQFTYSYGANGVLGFTNTSTGTISATSYTIVWGDGSASIAPVSSHQYTANGSYTITMMGMNSGTCTGVVSHVVNISNAGCALTPSVGVTMGSNGNVTLTNLTTGTVSSTTYSLVFGDGTFSTTPGIVWNTPITHQYMTNGTFIFYVHVQNNTTLTCNADYTVAITVSNATGTCNASFNYSVLPGTYSVSFVSTSTSTTSNTFYHWNFGDFDSSSVHSPVHGYAGPGTYVVNLMIGDTATGVYCSTQQTVVVPSTSYTCNLSASFTHTVGSGGSALFMGSASGSGIAYTWMFGDGYYSYGNPITHTYSAGGAYLVKLIAADTLCGDTVQQYVNITGLPCSANANFSLVPTGTPHNYNAILAYPWNVTSCTWNWGDGSTSNILYGSHTYSAAGNYSICLTVILSCGDTATYCAPYYVSRSQNNESDIIQVNVINRGYLLTGIAAVEAGDLDYSVYPNPSNGSFDLRLNTLTSGKVKISVYDVVGTQIYESESEPVRSGATRNINLDNASNGIYFIKISSDNKTYTKKLLIAK